MQRLVLLDGHAVLYRAYHALPSLTTSRGELVNAVFGFVSMILKVRDELQPSFLAVCFDLPGPTFRHKLFTDYQAQRPKMADELAGQIEKVKKTIKTMGIPFYEQEDYEADDVIGTLVHQAIQSSVFSYRFSDKGQSVSQFVDSKNRKTEKLTDHKPKTENREPITEIIIVTGDRDILQLVDDKTRVYLLIRGLTEATLYDKETVKKKTGLTPDQIPDYKALIGDSSDNYSGVAGIGPKSAVKLLQKYATLKQIYENLDKIEGSLREKLVKGKQEAELSQRLARIVKDVPVKFDWEKARLEDFAKPAIRKLFEELEFKSLLPRLKQKERKENKEDRENEENKNEQMGLF